MNEILEFLKKYTGNSDLFLNITYIRYIDSYVFKLGHYNEKTGRMSGATQAVNDVNMQHVLIDSKLTMLLIKLYEDIKEKEAEDERESGKASTGEVE